MQQGPHVTRTLGYHIDTPALAPFLGRAPKNRCINVATEQDESVDIEDLSGGSGLRSRNGWRKPYVHRNVARRELDEVVTLSDLPAESAPSANNQAAQADGDSGGQHPGIRMPSGTRFHIAARVQVADYSLFIPPSMFLSPDSVFLLNLFAQIVAPLQDPTIRTAGLSRYVVPRPRPILISSEVRMT